MDTAGSTRGLYEALRDYEGSDAWRELLAPWASASRDALDRALEPARTPYSKQAGAQWREEPLQELDWELHALSRVADLLILPHQPEPAAEQVITSSEHRDPCPHLPVRADLGQLVAFFEHFGLRAVEHRDFHPFFHEIVGIIPEESPHAAPVIERTHWPCLMLGEMLFLRAGVTIRCGRLYASTPWATSSTLFWSHLRRNRSTSDLSIGWGHNSSWRTSFRRDYACAGRLVFNAAGTAPAPYPPPGGTPEPETLPVHLREQVLIHRCLLSAPPALELDCWPWDWTCTIPL